MLPFKYRMLIKFIKLKHPNMSTGYFLLSEATKDYYIRTRDIINNYNNGEK